MTRKSAASLILLIYTAAPIASAQSPAGTALPVPAEEPQQSLPAAKTAPVTTETREQGMVTGASVTRGNNTYYLRPNTPAGSTLPGDVQSPGNRAAQWQILQFDLPRTPVTPSEAALPPQLPAEEK